MPSSNLNISPMTNPNSVHVCYTKLKDIREFLLLDSTITSGVFNSTGLYLEPICISRRRQWVVALGDIRDVF